LALSIYLFFSTFIDLLQGGIGVLSLAATLMFGVEHSMLFSTFIDSLLLGVGDAYTPG
jgi:hypothetical protein